jgi:hypothetical protein
MRRGVGVAVGEGKGVAAGVSAGRDLRTMARVAVRAMADCSSLAEDKILIVTPITAVTTNSIAANLTSFLDLIYIFSGDYSARA